MDIRQNFKPIKITRTSTEIINQIISKIEGDQLHNGDRLPSEIELAKLLETSRPTVREALSALKALGLVTTIAGSGNYIRKEAHSKTILSRVSVEIRTQQEFLEALEARLAVESEISRLAAIRAKSGELRRIASAVESMKKATTPDRLRKADYAFHLSLARASKNRLFVKFIEDVYNTLTVYYWDILEKAGKISEAFSIDDHLAIYEAIAQHNQKLAREAMIRHLDKIRRNFVGLLGKESFR
jgi:GntR family transcriptional repressor for pyruvate dehydrogenase complex